MRDQAQLFLYIEGKREPRVFVVGDDDEEAITVGLLRESSIDANDGEILIFIDDDEEPIERGRQHGRFKQRHHVHVHRCHRISVTVRYGGSGKTKDFAPSATIRRVFDWAMSKEAFDIDPIDAAKLTLALNDELLSGETRIGTLSGRPACALTLDLVNKDRFQG